MTPTGTKTQCRIRSDPRIARSRGARVWPVLLALVAAGCASGAGGESPFSEEESRIRLHVLNLNWADARLYAHRSSQRISLGSVAGKGEKTFTLDWPMSLPLRVEFDLLAGGRCMTRELSVDPGDFIELQIPGTISGGAC